MVEVFERKRRLLELILLAGKAGGRGGAVSARRSVQWTPGRDYRRDCRFAGYARYRQEASVETEAGYPCGAGDAGGRGSVRRRR